MIAVINPILWSKNFPKLTKPEQVTHIFLRDSDLECLGGGNLQQCLTIETLYNDHDQHALVRLDLEFRRTVLIQNGFSKMDLKFDGQTKLEWWFKGTEIYVLAYESDFSDARFFKAVKW